MKKRKLFSFFIAIVISVVCSAEGIVSARSFSLIGGILTEFGNSNMAALYHSMSPDTPRMTGSVFIMPMTLNF